MLKHFEVEGSDYECGFQMGELMADAVHRRIARFVPEDVFRMREKDLEPVEATCRELYPRILEQLRGLADGSGADYRHVLLLNAAELREGVGGCTDIAEVAAGKLALSHNEDTGEGQDGYDDCALVTFKLPNVSMTSFAYAGEPGGNAYNWNEHGFFFSINYLVPLNNAEVNDRTPRDFASRAVMEAKSIDDALEMLRLSRCASGYHYFMGQGDRIVSVEQWRDELNVLEVGGASVHANHYLRLAQGAPADESTRLRQKRAQELIDAGTPALEVLSDRSNAPYTICRLSGDYGLTLSRAQFLSLEKKVTIYDPNTKEAEYVLEL